MTMTARTRIVTLSLAMLSLPGCTNEPIDLGHDDVTRGSGGAASAGNGSGVAASGSTRDAGKPGAGADAGAGARSESGGSSGKDASQPDDASAGAGRSGLGDTGGSTGTEHSGGSSAAGGSDSDSGGRTESGGRSSSGGGGGKTSSGGSTQSGGAGSGGDTSTGGSTESGGSAAGGSTGTGGASTGGGGATGGNADITGPCDIYAAASPATPCVAAYSTTRLLYSQYSGPLYQVRSGSSSQNTGSGGTVHDIGMTADGYADADALDTACTGSTCTISILYDQSGNGNDLTVAKKGCLGEAASLDDYESIATKGSVQLNGRKVYGLYMDPRQGYRKNDSTTMPTGAVEQGIYEVIDGKRYGTGCCWNFGNAGTDPCDFVSTSALYFGAALGGVGDGSGPWFYADSGTGFWPGESGMVCGNGDPCTVYPSVDFGIGVGILKISPGSSTRYAIKFGDTQAESLRALYDGEARVSTEAAGGIILGISTMNDNGGQGTFFEGAITAGWPSDATDDLVLENIRAAEYAR